MKGKKKKKATLVNEDRKSEDRFAKIRRYKFLFRSDLPSYPDAFQGEILESGSFLGGEKKSR